MSLINQHVSNYNYAIFVINVKCCLALFIAITPPIITPYSGEKTIEEGIQKVIKCVAKASPRPSANWYRNGKKLNITNCTSANDKSCENVIYEVYEENPGSALHTTFSTQVLKIRSVLYPRDQGKFVCKATNGYDPPAELDVELDVQGMYIAIYDN